MKSYARADSYLRHTALVFAALIPLFLFKRTLADHATQIICMVFVLHCLLMRDWKWLRHGLYWPLFVLWLLLILTPAFLSDAAPGELMAASLWVRWPLLFVALTSWVLIEKRDFIWPRRVLIFAVAFVCVDALWQYATGVSLTGYATVDGGRLTGPFKRPLPGIYLTKISFAACAVIALEYAVRRRVLMATCAMLILCFFTILLSGERSPSAIVLLALTTMIGVGGYYHKQWRIPLMTALIALLVMVLLLCLNEPYLQHRIAQSREHLADFGNSVYGQLWQAAAIMGREHWLTGVGFKQFLPACRLLTQIHYCDIHAHNLYLQWFAIAGLPATLLFIGWVMCLCRYCVRVMMPPERKANTMLFAAAMAILIVNFFPLAIAQNIFSNWAAGLLWYSLSITLAALACHVRSNR